LECRHSLRSEQPADQNKRITINLKAANAALEARAKLKAPLIGRGLVSGGRLHPSAKNSLASRKAARQSEQEQVTK